MTKTLTEAEKLFYKLKNTDRLLDAIKRKDKEEVLLALEGGADPNGYPRRKQSRIALNACIGINSIELAEILLQHGADINVRGSDGSTPLTRAIWSNNSKFIEFLLEHNANPNAQGKGLALNIAIGKRDYKKAQLLIDYGADVNAFDTNGFSPLFTAVALNNMKSIQFLLERGADLHKTRKDGGTALMRSVRSVLEVTTFLVQQGLDINARDDQGRTALFWALNDMGKYSLQTALLLLEHGADSTILTNDGECCALEFIESLVINNFDDEDEYDKLLLLAQKLFMAVDDKTFRKIKKKLNEEKGILYFIDDHLIPFIAQIELDRVARVQDDVELNVI